MTITAEHKRKIEEVVSVFETSKRQGNYDKITLLKDWEREDGVRYHQITYGRMQTTESKNLKKLLTMYVANKGKHAEALALYLPKIGKSPSLYQDQKLLQLLSDAGKNDLIMKKTQDDFFNLVYWKPAHDWFVTNGFTLGLSMLVIFDSFIHSGGILTFLRKRFPALTPAKGGIEQDWIAQYVDVRDQWLGTHSDAVLRNTVYRTKCFKTQITSGNWDLVAPINANGIIVT